MKNKRILIGLGVIVVLLVIFFSVLYLIGRSAGTSGGFAFGDKIASWKSRGSSPNHPESSRRSTNISRMTA